LRILKVFTEIHVQKIITMKNGCPNDLRVQIGLNMMTPAIWLSGNEEWILGGEALYNGTVIL
jgi:hypothetical protein